MSSIFDLFSREPSPLPPPSFQQPFANSPLMGAAGVALQALGLGLTGLNLSTSDTTPLPSGFLVAGPVVGYRAWRVLCNPIRLTSFMMAQEWPPGIPLQAHCASLAQSKVPHDHCGCGIYAMKRLDQVDAAEGGGLTVVGAVALWGQVIEAESGYRAETAYPLWLMFPKPKGMPPGFPWPVPLYRRLVRDLSDAYGVPVTCEEDGDADPSR